MAKDRKSESILSNIKCAILDRFDESDEEPQLRRSKRLKRLAAEGQRNQF
jgi:hypothetical protein